jgi:hypothetical protein
MRLYKCGSISALARLSRNDAAAGRQVLTPWQWGLSWVFLYLIISFIMGMEEAGMRDQARNPLLHEFKSDLLPDGRYPPWTVMVCWNNDGKDRVKDVEVVFQPSGLKHNSELGHAYHVYANEWESALAVDYLNSPKSIFEYLRSKPFASDEELKRALEEFAWIEGCDWANEYLRAFDP